MSRHHFYVQVNPYPKSEQNDFGSDIYNPIHKNYLPDGSGTDEHDLPSVENTDLEGTQTTQANPLRYRPAHYVPFKVPLFDEQYSQIQQDVYRNLKEQGKATSADKPDPLYRWYYRPELQFSQYNFDAKSLIVNQIDDEGTESTTEIKIEDEGTDFGPVFDDYTDSVELLFDLLGPELDRLPALENDREFVLSLGGEEAIATIGADGKVVFNNPDHLARLTEEDLLSLRLYLNGDAGNILWEYAFQPLFINTGLKPARYGDTVYVNADQPEIELSAFLLFPDEDEDYRLIWTIEEGNGTISRSVQPLISGSATTTLSLTPHINNLVKVSAALADEPDNKVFSSKIGVLPGMPSQLSIMNAEGEIFEQGMGEYKVQVSVKDAHSNDVSDGLPVSFITDGSLYVAKQKSTTLNGTADAILKGAYKPGNYKLNIQAGSGSKTQNITVKGLTKEFINMPTSAIAGESYSAQIQVTAAGEPAINTYIQLGISGAILEQSHLKTDENGLINFIIHTPIKGGLVSVSAKTGFDNELKANFTVSAPTQELKTSKTFMLANTSLSNQTITMTGSPSQTWQLDFDQAHFPNRSPLYLNRFYDLRNDDSYKYLAEHNAQRSNDGPEYGLFSLDLKEGEQGTSEWQLLYKEELAPQLPAIAFWLKTSADGKVVSTVDGKVNLTLNAGTLDLSLETASQTLHVSQAGLVHDQWYQVAFGLQADHAYLSVNEDITQQSIATTMSWEGTVDAAWLTIGDGFVGKVSGLRLYDWASTPLLKLSETNGIYAANGETVINLEAQSASQIYNTSVVIKSDSGHSVPITILAEDNYQKYRTAITNIYGAGDNVQDHISLAQYFPSIDQPMQSLFSEVSNNDDLGALESVLVASSWLGMRNELSDIEPHLIALQNYYRQHDQHELVFALADELSQSLMNAQAGNNLRLMSLRTGLLVWGEVLAASPQAADVIATGIQNKTDLWTWLRYLSLPAEGWAGEIIPIPLPHNTCDKVDPEINIGTILEYSSIPCRVTGTLAAEVINNWVDADSEIAANKRLLTRQIEIITAGLKGAPLEITKQVFLSGTTTNIASNWSPLPEAHANPAVAAGRLVVFALKTGAKAGFGNAPPNLMNFFKNRTTSRFQAHEILAAIAYLESRREGGEFACEGCKFINEEVFEQINKNLRAWFNGLSLVNNGEIPNEAKQQRMCTLTNQAHGAALELVGTAAYHALYEFGSSVGVTDSDKYEILSADQYIRIPLRDKEDGEYRRIADGDYGRVPDLIMKGRGEFKRYWIEFKSWRKGVGFTRRADGSSSINPWKLSIKTSNQYPHAHKQHFLDYVATQGKLTDVWKDDVDLQRGKYTIDRVTNLDLRAGTNRTWVQVWEKEHDARGYQPLTKVNDKWKIGDTVYIKRANPWISAKAKDIITDTEISSSGFDLVQQYLTQAPSKIRNQEFKTTVGYPLANHYERYAKNQIGKNSSTVAPFTLANMLAIEVGEDAGKKIAKKLTEQIANSDFAEYLGAGDLSTEQIAELRDKVQESVQQQMGKLGEVSAAIDEYTPQIWLDFEEALQSQVAGAMGDDIREALENFELPESLQDQFCEAVVQ